MKVLVVLSVAFALTSAVEDFRPKVVLEEASSTVIPIISFNKEQGTDGSYKTDYETGNNIIAQESGYLQRSENVDEVDSLVQQGSYSYIAPDGQTIVATYIADKNGFRVQGDHIPTPPPVSAEIQKGLDLIYAGIEANRKRDELEAKNNPEAALKQEEKANLNYKGFYYQ